MATFDLGDLTSQSIKKSEFASSGNNDFIDIYRFSANTNSELDIFLKNNSGFTLFPSGSFGFGTVLTDDISMDLSLLFDSNGNGVLDPEDKPLAISNGSNRGDESIVYNGEAGTYFALVQPRDEFNIAYGGYDLNISVSTSPENTLPEPAGEFPVEPPVALPNATPPDNADNPEPNPQPNPDVPPTFVEVPALGEGNTIALTIDKVGFSGTGELAVFSADDEKGTNKEKIAGFSILEDGQLPTDYDPSFTLDKDKISTGKFLQFDLVEKGQTQKSPTPMALDDGKISLGFDGGTEISFESATESEKTNLLLDDAATIDLSQQKNKLSKISFSVYREAGYNNTVGLYKMDSADGAVLDPILGTRMRPGDTGYKEAAIAQKLDIMLTGENNQVKTFSTTVEDTQFLGTFLIADSSDLMSENVYFSHGAANKNSNDHVKMLGNNTFGFEDLPGLGDKDYNDFVVAFEIA